jgi:hypothetical protein
VLAEHDLTEDQWRTLEAICDTVVPAFSPEQARQNVAAIRRMVPASTSDELIIQYLEEAPSKVPEFRAMFQRLLFRVLPEADRKTLVMLLNVLG